MVKEIRPGFRPIIDSELGVEAQMKRDNAAREAMEQKAKLFKEVEDIEITEEDLAELDLPDLELMDTERFLALAKRVMDNADNIINRSDSLLNTLVPKDPVVVDIDIKEDLDDLGITYEEAEGKLTIPPQSVDCVMRIACHNPYEGELTGMVPTNTDPSKALQYLKKGVGKDVIKQHFPAFGLEFLFFVIRLAAIIIIVMLLSYLCKFFGKLPVVGKYMKDHIDKACEGVTREIDKALLGDGSLKQKACGRRMDMVKLIETSARNMRRRILKGKSGVAEGEADEGKSVCAPGYVPTGGQIGKARTIAREIIKSELGDSTKPTATNTESSMIRELRKTAVKYRAMGGDIIRQVETAPGVYAVDSVRGSLISTFSTINGILKGVDEGLSGIVQLEFMDEVGGRNVAWWREVICCVTRLLFVFFWSQGRGGDLRDFFSGKKDWKVGKNERMIAEALDSILGWMLGSSHINIDFQFPFDGDLVMGPIYMSLSEVLSIVLSMVYEELDQKMNVFIETPGVDEAVDLCHPFRYFIDIIRCNINNLFSNAMELLSTLWLTSNEKLKSFDSMFEVVLMKRNVNLFRNVIKLIMNLGSRLRQFCDLNKVSNKDDVIEVMAEVAKQAGLSLDDDLKKRMKKQGVIGRLDALSDESRKQLLTPIYKNYDQPAGPDPDAYINTKFMRKDRGAGILDINLQTSPMYKPDIDIIETVGDEALDPTSPISDAALDEGAKIDVCGEKFKELLRKISIES